MKLVTGIAVLLLAITVNALPSTEAPEVASADSLVAPGAVLFEPAVEAKATVDSLLQEGKDMGACATLASTTIKEVEDSVGAQQSILNALDNGDKCPLKGQAGVDAAKKALEDAKQDKADADKAYGAAKAAPVAFGPKAFNTMDQNSCSIFTNDPAYIAAVGAKDRAKKSAEQAAGAVKNAGDALDAAKEAQEKARKECYCTVRANYNKAWAAATENNEENTKAYTKGKHMQCVLDGKDADDCDVGDIPEVKAIDLADGVPADVCDGGGGGAWDPSLGNTGLTYTDGNSKVTGVGDGHSWTSAYGKKTIIANPGTYTWTFKVISQKNTHTNSWDMYVGIINDNSPRVPNSYECRNRDCIGYVAEQGDFQQNSNIMNKPATPYTTGDTITLKLTVPASGKGSVEYFKNGASVGVATTSMPTGSNIKYRAYVSLGTSGDTVQLVEGEAPQENNEENTETLTGCGKMHKAPANLQTKSGWTICYLKGSDPQSDRTAQCKTLVPHNGKFGCWHYHSNNWNPSNGGSKNPPTQACGENTQQSTTYAGWGGTSHYLVACIKN